MRITAFCCLMSMPACLERFEVGEEGGFADKCFIPVVTIYQIKEKSSLSFYLFMCFVRVSQ